MADYISGNNARKLNTAAPQRRNQEQIEKARREHRRRNAVRKNRERELAISKGYAIFLSFCLFVSAGFAVSLIRMQSTISTHLRDIAALESQITDKKADNDAKYKALITSVNLNDIKNRAINELGMTYPREDQIVYYSIDQTDFMDQYYDLPQ